MKLLKRTTLKFVNSVQDWNPKDEYGETPYDIAKTKGCKNIVDLLESAKQKQRRNKKSKLEWLT